MSDKDNELQEQEIVRRRDTALRRALSTPPQPHKSIVSDRKKKAGSRPKSRGRHSAKSD